MLFWQSGQKITVMHVQQSIKQASWLMLSCQLKHHSHNTCKTRETAIILVLNLLSILYCIVHQDTSCHYYLVCSESSGTQPGIFLKCIVTSQSFRFIGMQQLSLPKRIQAQVVCSSIFLAKRTCDPQIVTLIVYSKASNKQ